MAQATEARDTGRSASLDLDRLELTGHDSLVIEGRWYGVRGRRFVRPTLTLLAGGERRRLLADVEHKPWAAQDGDRWLAAFPWKADQATHMTDLELTVAPDIVVALPSPDARAGVRRRQDRLDPGRSTVGASRGRQLDEAEKKPARVQAGNARDSADLARHEAAVEKLDELDAALAGRQAAITERKIADAEREAAIAQRNAAVTERKTAIAERHAAIAERDQAVHAAHRLTTELGDVRRMTTSPEPASEADPRPPPAPSAPVHPPTDCRATTRRLARAARAGRPGWSPLRC